MSSNRAPCSRSQRLRLGYLLAGARCAFTRESQRTPGASASLRSLGGSISKMVPRSNRNFMTNAWSEFRRAPPFMAARHTLWYCEGRSEPMPKDGYASGTTKWWLGSAFRSSKPWRPQPPRAGDALSSARRTWALLGWVSEREVKTRAPSEPDERAMLRVPGEFSHVLKHRGVKHQRNQRGGPNGIRTRVWSWSRFRHDFQSLPSGMTRKKSTWLKHARKRFPSKLAQRPESLVRIGARNVPTATVWVPFEFRVRVLF